MKRTLKTLYAKNSLDLPPYVVVCGPLHDVKKSILVVNDFEYCIYGPDSTIAAVEKCYKIVKFLQKNFPKAAINAYQFIEVYSFGIKVSHAAAVGKFINAVRNKISFMKEVKKKKSSKKGEAQKTREFSNEKSNKKKSQKKRKQKFSSSTENYKKQKT